MKNFESLNIIAKAMFVLALVIISNSPLFSLLIVAYYSSTFNFDSRTKVKIRNIIISLTLAGVIDISLRVLGILDQTSTLAILYVVASTLYISLLGLESVKQDMSGELDKHVEQDIVTSKKMETEVKITKKKIDVEIYDFNKRKGEILSSRLNSKKGNTIRR